MDTAWTLARFSSPLSPAAEMRVIGATTISEYRKYIESDPALERRFQLLWINEPSKEDAIGILGGLKAKLEEHHGLRISDDALNKAVELSMRFMPDHRVAGQGDRYRRRSVRSAHAGHLVAARRAAECPI